MFSDIFWIVYLIYVILVLQYVQSITKMFIFTVCYELIQYRTFVLQELSIHKLYFDDQILISDCNREVDERKRKRNKKWTREA